MKKLMQFVAGLLLLGSSVSTSLAVPITYELSGALTGEFNGTPFTAAPFSFQVTADTDNVQAISLFAVNDIAAVGNYTPLFNGPALAGILNITGVGTFTFAEQLWVWATQGNSLNAGVLGIGTDGGGDIIDVQDLFFESYHLVSPVTALPVSLWQVGVSAFAVEGSSQGILTLADAASLTFQASGGVVPEPATVVLLGFGAAGLMIMRRRRS